MKKILISLLFLLFGTSAYADCNIKSGSINILANENNIKIHAMEFI